MAKKQFEWDYAAAGDLLLKSKEIADFCEQEAARLTRSTGVEYIPDVRKGSQRVRAGAYDSMRHEDGQYRKRSNGRLVYTQNKIKE